MSADPFANTTTVKNILQHVISPKIVRGASGGYVTKTDLVNVHNLVFSETATTLGEPEAPLTAQCGTYTLLVDAETIPIIHSRVTANSVVLANVMTLSSQSVKHVIYDEIMGGFNIQLTGTTGTQGIRVGWFIAAF